MSATQQEIDEADRDTQMVAALAEGLNPTQAAATVGVSVRTLYRRVADPQFAARLAVAKAGRWAEQAAELRTEFRRSVATLRTLRDDEQVHASTRQRAALAICELALKVASVTDQDVRLAALEEALADIKESRE